VLVAFRLIRAQMAAGSEDCTDDIGRTIVMAWLQLMLLVVVTMSLAGCELAGGIFKAGAWFGALAVIILIAIVGIVAVKLRG
jgi:hypothetical protein